VAVPQGRARRVSGHLSPDAGSCAHQAARTLQESLRTAVTNMIETGHRGQKWPQRETVTRKHTLPTHTVGSQSPHRLPHQASVEVCLASELVFFQSRTTTKQKELGSCRGPGQRLTHCPGHGRHLQVCSWSPAHVHIRASPFLPLLRAPTKAPCADHGLS